MQTIPPFDYTDENVEKWNRLNDFILTEIKNIVDLVFDNREFLGKEEKLHEAIYGGHPNEDGCKIWADALYKKIEEISLL